MATYTAITDAEIDQDSPITQTLMTKYRDNLIAVVEGAPSAIKILGLAAATNDEVEVLTVTAADTYTVGVANDITIGDATTASTSYQTARTIDIVAVTGTVRFYASHRTLNSSYTSFLKVSKNGTLVASWTTTSTTAVERSSDISVVPGDQITWEHAISNSVTFSAVSNLSETASNGYQPRSLLIASTDA